MGISDIQYPRIGSIKSIQVPGAYVQLAKIIDNRTKDGIKFTLVRWIDIRRDAEWIRSCDIPPDRS